MRGQRLKQTDAEAGAAPEGDVINVRGGPRNSDQRLSDKKRWEEGEEKDNLNNQ